MSLTSRLFWNLQPLSRTTSFVTFLTLTLSGCTSAAPTLTGPSRAQSADSTVALTVQVLIRGSQEAIPSATAVASSPARSVSGLTDASGRVTLNVPALQSIDVEVTAPGYRGFGASGTLQSSELWTFYLERSP